MVKGVFLDFYGTVVHEDDAVIAAITRLIRDTGNGADSKKIGHYWWECFQGMFQAAWGEKFRTQRELELLSLRQTLIHFASTENAEKLSEGMFAFWQKPPIFDDARAFLVRCPVPVYILSNIDDRDISDALSFHGLRPQGVFTSEMVRSYKPRPELFLHALEKTGLSSREVIHIGDSLSGDYRGAKAAGLEAVWVNRKGKPAPEGVFWVEKLTELLDTDYFAL